VFYDAFLKHLFFSPLVNDVFLKHLVYDVFLKHLFFFATKFFAAPGYGSGGKCTVLEPSVISLGPMSRRALFLISDKWFDGDYVWKSSETRRHFRQFFIVQDAVELKNLNKELHRIRTELLSRRFWALTIELRLSYQRSTYDYIIQTKKQNRS